MIYTNKRDKNSNKKANKEVGNANDEPRINL